MRCGMQRSLNVGLKAFADPEILAEALVQFDRCRSACNIAPP
jgi:hypothetical protein